MANIRGLKYFIKRNKFLMKQWFCFYNYVLGNNRIINRGYKNIINIKFSSLKQVKILIVGNNNLIDIGESSSLSNIYIYINGSNHVLKIGKNVAYGKGVLWLEDNNCKISIGDNTTIEDAHIAVTEQDGCIYIGEDCMFSKNIDIRNGDSHSIIDLETRQRINFAKNIIIGNHVWLGSYSQVLKGVKIGENSIVGIRSVITEEVLPNSIYAGIPARLIKNNITWLRERLPRHKIKE